MMPQKQSPVYEIFCGLEYGSEKGEITSAPVGKLSWVVICCLTSSNCPPWYIALELSDRPVKHRPTPPLLLLPLTDERGFGNEKQ